MCGLIEGRRDWSCIKTDIYIVGLMIKVNQSMSFTFLYSLICLPCMH